MKTAEVVVGVVLRGVMTVDDAADVVALENLCLVVALFLEALDEGVGIAHGNVTGEHDAELFLWSVECGVWIEITVCACYNNRVCHRFIL